jgi:hypothetical protein
MMSKIVTRFRGLRDSSKHKEAARAHQAISDVELEVASWNTRRQTHKREQARYHDSNDDTKHPRIELVDPQQPYSAKLIESRPSNDLRRHNKCGFAGCSTKRFISVTALDVHNAVTHGIAEVPTYAGETGCTVMDMLRLEQALYFKLKR